MSAKPPHPDKVNINLTLIRGGLDPLVESSPELVPPDCDLVPLKSKSRFASQLAQLALQIERNVSAIRRL